MEKELRGQYIIIISNNNIVISLVYCPHNLNLKPGARKFKLDLRFSRVVGDSA
jgi:hypothetical protein